MEEGFFSVRLPSEQVAGAWAGWAKDWGGRLGRRIGKAGGRKSMGCFRAGSLPGDTPDLTAVFDLLDADARGFY
jgi:hypothetical protein